MRIKPAEYEPSAYVEETLEFMLKFDDYITRNYGVRCRDHVTGCAVCDMWKLRDDVKKILCD